MKVVILAGGMGSRISEESYLRPKPMIEVGGYPILWHIMKIYAAQGFNDFIICLGYKGYEIKNYFSSYYMRHSNVFFDFSTDPYTCLTTNSGVDPWKISLVDTGLDTFTGGRIKRVESYLNNEPFLLTYGDGVSNVNLRALIDNHVASGSEVTLTAVQPRGKFGALTISKDSKVLNFNEKPKSSWISGGFFVMEPSVFSYIENDSTVFEEEPLSNLAKKGQLSAYLHNDFWHPMDTLRDKNYLESLWNAGKAPWKIWDN